MNTIYLVLSSAIVLLFSFIFYKTRDSPITGASTSTESIYFLTPQEKQSYCAGSCSWVDPPAPSGYAAFDPLGYQDYNSTLPHDLQSLTDMNTMPFDYTGLAQAQSAFVPQAITSTPDPLVDFIPQQTVY